MHQICFGKAQEHVHAVRVEPNLFYRAHNAPDLLFWSDVIPTQKE